MDNTQKNRIKSAMVVYELETALGNYVIENEVLDNLSEKNTTMISQREENNGNAIKNNQISFLVESSYLDEIFNLAIDTTDGTILNMYMRELKDLCTYLGIFDIRNAISHPNRPFPDSYWFRSATIASDPLIEKLGLGSIRKALNFAIEESLSLPPEEWISNVKWAIPNTLPNSFDHEITGLLGRDKDFSDLNKTLLNSRINLIAVVAPGGIGKTALILQFLKDLSLTPSFSSKINAIVFCSLKNEILTADGLQIIEAINGIDQIKECILLDINLLYQKSYSTFESACEGLEGEKILICIDNLETLLMHSQKEFIAFNHSLPLLWRLIVTSRISIDSATTVPLEPLGKRYAINLSRNYLKKRGVQHIDQSVLENIADRANYNPLAIRLTIDFYIKGGDISQSIQQSQKDIASFSYKNLIESLSENSIAILEAIYVLEESIKTELIDFLELTNEEISESINELSKTSLIIRNTNQEGIDSFKLSDSIRDLLLINPKNIEVRTRIAENLKLMKEKILLQTTRNVQLGLTEFDEDFVEPSTERTLHAAILDLNKFLSNKLVNRKHSDLVNLKKKFSDILTYSSKDYQVYYNFSRVLAELKDKAGQLRSLEKSLEINSNCYRATLAIGKYHFHNGDYDKALDVFDKLIMKGFNNPEVTARNFSFSLTKLRLLCLLYLSKYDVILKITDNWGEDSNWSAVYGTYRASAYKRQSETLKNNQLEREKLIGETISTFNQIFSDGDYPIIACIESNKIIKEFEFILANNVYSTKLVVKYITFIARHYFNIVSRLRDETIDSRESKDLLKKVYNFDLKINPLHSAEWYSIKTETTYDEDHIEELLNDGYIIVEVYNIPDRSEGFSNFIFAKNELGQQFYLHVNKFDEGWNRWGYIEIGTKLGVKYDRISENGKPTNVREILEIDKYLI
jgi:DNA-binding MarR family transcriptional regulator